MSMNIGDMVEDFVLPGTGGNFSLSANRGQAVVLYFYPKDDTPGCTIEGNEFSALLPEFSAAGATVAGVSRDGVASHERFRSKFSYAHHLLSDKDETLCGLFDVIKEKIMYGRPARVISRSTFLIGRDGKLAKEWRGIKDAAGHAAEVLQAVKALPAGS